MRSIKQVDFIVLCNQKENTKKTDFFLQRLNDLDTEADNIARVRAILVPVGEDSEFLRTPRFKKSVERFENIEVTVANANRYPTEPRAWNLGLYHALRTGEADFYVFLHDSDTILQNRLLSYYMWLFNSAHNPEVVGAVALSSNVLVKTAPPKHSKMWYADDVFLRGCCFRADAVKSTGPFDESLIYRAYEFDYSSRMVHHYGYLVRVGKEENTFIQFGQENLSPDHEKLRFLNKQSRVWNARKWFHKGIWPDHKGVRPNCYVRAGTFGDKTQGRTMKDFLSYFGTDRDRTVERLSTLYSDDSIKRAVDMSGAFIKKPIGGFILKGVMEDGPKIFDNGYIQTNVECKLEYPDLLWETKNVY